MAQVAQWLMVAENEIARGPNDARLHEKFGYKLDHPAAVAKSDRLLEIFENYLKGHTWLVNERPTIADIACYPNLALGHEGGAPIGRRPNILEWIARIKVLPSYVGMPAI